MSTVGSRTDGGEREGKRQRSGAAGSIGVDPRAVASTRRVEHTPGTYLSELQAAVDEAGPADVLRTLAREGPGFGRDVAAALDRDPSTVSHHLSRLEEDGLVERERDGRSIVNRLTSTAEATLAPRVGNPVEADAGPGDAGAARAGD